jgi:hypothetical protein
MLELDNVENAVSVHVAGGFNTEQYFEFEGREAGLSESKSVENDAPEADSSKVEPKQIPNGEIFGEGDPNYSPKPFELGYDPTTDKTVLAFQDVIADCEKKFAGYREVLNEGLAVAYKAYFLYKDRAGKYAKETLFDWLKQQVLAKGYEYAEGKSQAEHMILQLTFGEMTTATKSQRARLFRLAYSKKEKLVTPEYFPVWLKEKGGVVNALKPKNPKSSETLATERQARKDNMRTKVRAMSLGEVKDIAVRGLAPAPDKALALAIIERNADGTFTVLGFTDEEFALDTACSAYGKTVK